jgi:hypothetical protein
MKKIYKFFCIVVTVFSIQIHASERQIDAAADCAAQMFVMTAVGRSIDGLGKYFEEQSRFINMMLGLYMERQTGGKITNGMVSNIRETKLRSYETNYISALTEKSLSNCMGWSFALAQILQNNQASSEQKLKDALVNGPKPLDRYDYPFDDDTQLPNWVLIAKQNWQESGYMTPGKLRESLRQ